MRALASPALHRAVAPAGRRPSPGIAWHRPSFLSFVAALFLAPLAGCDGASEIQRFDLNARGELEITLFVDLDQNGTPSAADPRPVGQPLALRFQGVRDTLATVETGTGGVATATGLPVGNYRIDVPSALLGDSLRVRGLLPDPVPVTPGGSTPVALSLAFLEVPASALAALPPGRRVHVRGVALNASGSLPGGAVHLRSEAGSVRALVTTGPAVAVGDTVRVLGRVAQVGPGRVLETSRLVRLSDAEFPDPPLPVAIGTGSLGGAGGVAPPGGGPAPAPGSLGGDLVRISGAQVLQSSTQDGVVTVRVDDGTGEGVARIASGQLAEAGLPVPTPGAVVSLTGVLVPEATGPGGGGGSEAGRWVLRTRRGADLAVEARGTVRGRVFEDRNGTNAFDGGDLPLAGVELRLLPEGGGGVPAAVVVSGSDGRFEAAGLPVGSYTVEPVAATLPAGLSVRLLAPSPLAVATGATTEVVLALGFPTVSPAGARALPEGAGVFVRGVVLNTPTDHGDGAIHLFAEGQALRIPGILPPAVQPGDQVRVRGVVERRLGQPVLAPGGLPFIEGTAGVPAATILSTGEAATASGGTRDAQLVQVRAVTVVEAAPDGEIWRVRVDDGSGPLVLRVRLAGVGLTATTAASFFETGRRLTVRGLLVPFAPPPPGDGDDGVEPDPDDADTPGGWELRPRTAADLEVP